jgi:hypothetical protein
MASVWRMTRLVVTGTASVLLTACGPSADQEAQEARDRAGSWAMGLKVGVEQWASDIVPRHFLRSLITAADSDVTREAARVRKSAGGSAAAPLETVHAALAQLSMDVARSDESAALETASALVARVPPARVSPSARPEALRQSSLAADENR